MGRAAKVLAREKARLTVGKSAAGKSAAHSALTFRDFVPRFEVLALFGDVLGIFGKVWKCVK